MCVVTATSRLAAGDYFFTRKGAQKLLSDWGRDTSIVVRNFDFRLPAVVNITDRNVVGSFSNKPMPVVTVASGLAAGEYIV